MTSRWWSCEALLMTTTQNPRVHRDGSISINGTTVGSVVRQVVPGAPGQSWRVEFRGFDANGNEVTVQSSRRLAVEHVVLRAR